MSRVRRDMALDERASIAHKTRPGREVPAVSVYVDQAGFWLSGGGIEDVSDIMKRVNEAQNAAKNVASELASRFHCADREEAR
jgi:hypothetical protein